MADTTTILPSNSTAFERAIEQVSAERWDKLDVDVIRRARDPWTCPEHLLPQLAYQRSVDIWDENWPVDKKRQVIADAPQDHKLKGTEEGLRRYIDHAEARLQQLVTPPQFFAVAPSMSKEDWDAYIRKHPRVRIPLISLTEPLNNGFVVGHAAVGHDTVGDDRGRWLRGRRAYLEHDGVSTPLDLATRVIEGETRTAVEHYWISVPGKGVAFAAIGEFAVGHSFVGGWDIPPRTYAFAVDRDYHHESSRLELTSTPVGYQPRDTRYTRESDTAAAGLSLAVGHDAVGHGCVGRNGYGGELLADVIYLHDPEVAAPTVDALSFVGHSRFGMPAHTAEMIIDMQSTLSDRVFVVGDSAVGADAILPGDTSRREFLLDAVAASKRLSDRTLVSFETMRERTLADGIPLDGNIRLDQLVRATI